MEHDPFIDDFPINTSIIPLGISSIKWSNPGTRLSHHFRHYKMEKKRLGVVFERLIIIFINYHFWARTILQSHFWAYCRKAVDLGRVEQATSL